MIEIFLCDYALPGLIRRVASQVLQKYLQEVEEESIRDNFVIVYELLDEVMDYGYPQVTDSKILQEYITIEANKTSLVRSSPARLSCASTALDGVFEGPRQPLITMRLLHCSRWQEHLLQQ